MFVQFQYATNWAPVRRADAVLRAATSSGTVYPPRGGDESGTNIRGRRKVRRETTRAGGYRGLLERKRNNEKWPLTLGLPPVVAGGTFAIGSSGTWCVGLSARGLYYRHAKRADHRQAVLPASAMIYQE